MSRPLEIGAIKLSTVDGPIVIAGWNDGTFGVDWRACFHDLDGCPGGYVVSHLATGYALLAIVANIEDIETFLGKLHALGDWSATNIEQARSMLEMRRPAMRELYATVTHHDPKCFVMAPGDHGTRYHGHA